MYALIDFGVVHVVKNIHRKYFKSHCVDDCNMFIYANVLTLNRFYTTHDLRLNKNIFEIALYVGRIYPIIID